MSRLLCIDARSKTHAPYFRENVHGFLVRASNGVFSQVNAAMGRQSEEIRMALSMHPHTAITIERSSTIRLFINIYSASNEPGLIHPHPSLFPFIVLSDSMESIRMDFNEFILVIWRNLFDYDWALGKSIWIGEQQEIYFIIHSPEEFSQSRFKFLLAIHLRSSESFRKIDHSTQKCICNFNFQVNFQFIVVVWFAFQLQDKRSIFS